MSISKRRPVILCFHGYGTNASIFKVQTRHLRAALDPDLQFVFLDAPFTAPPGPGVLPYFEDCGPFYSWFSSSQRDMSPENGTADLVVILQTIDDCLSKNDLRIEDAVGVLGFSQGALAASLLAALHQHGQSSTWHNLKVAILLCGAYHDVLPLMLGGTRLDLPSIHVHGLRDPILSSSRLLHSRMFAGPGAVKVELDIGHTLPHEYVDVVEIAQLVRKAVLWQRPSISVQ